jgi:hypothetical protein
LSENLTGEHVEERHKRLKRGEGGKINEDVGGKRRFDKI